MALAPQIDHGSAGAAVRQPVQRWAGHIGLSKWVTNCEARHAIGVAQHGLGNLYASVCSITAGTRSRVHSSMHATAWRARPLAEALPIMAGNLRP
jgi:hypothetical protein